MTMGSIYGHVRYAAVKIMKQMNKKTKSLHRVQFDVEDIAVRTIFEVHGNMETYYIYNSKNVMSIDAMRTNDWRHQHIDESKAHDKMYYAMNRVRIAKRKHDRRVNAPEATAKRDATYRVDNPRLGFLGRRVVQHCVKTVPDGYVWHHVIYDHANPLDNVVLLSRSSHAMGHALLRKLGIEIPHINTDK